MKSIRRRKRRGERSKIILNQVRQRVRNLIGITKRAVAGVTLHPRNMILISTIQERKTIKDESMVTHLKILTRIGITEETRADTRIPTSITIGGAAKVERASKSLLIVHVIKVLTLRGTVGSGKNRQKHSRSDSDSG